MDLARGPDARPTDVGICTAARANGSFSRSLFRRRFQLRRGPGHAPARLTADSRYVLWVNGQELGRGPARSQPSRQRYDAYDLAPYLVSGTNVVAVLVTYYGRATSFWQPAPAGSSSDAVLVFEARLSEGTARRSSSRTGTGGCSAPPPGPSRRIPGPPWRACPWRSYDARELPAGWRDAGFDDSAWARAAVVSATHIGGLAQSRPPTYPFGRLLPGGISQQVGERVGPAAVLDSSSRPAPGGRRTTPPVGCGRSCSPTPSRTRRWSCP